MIVSRLKGRLGNQMFQCAAGLGLAARHGTELILDTSWMEQFRRGGEEVRYELDIFDMGVRVCPVWEVARVPNPRRAVYALQRLRPSRRRFVHIVEEDTSTNAFQPAAMTAPDDTYLLGYWQFEDYFAGQAEHVRQAFTFPGMSDESERIAEEIRATAALSIHVRRGDYMKHELLGFLDETYYARAVEQIAAIKAEIHVFVFSDEPGWCRQNLRFPFPMTIVDRPLSEERAWEDMHLISLCRDHVVSNSTFSWWGAWLNGSPSKVVVAPERWSLGTKRIGDPIPSHWRRV